MGKKPSKFGENTSLEDFWGEIKLILIIIQRELLCSKDQHLRRESSFGHRIWVTFFFPLNYSIGSGFNRSGKQKKTLSDDSSSPLPSKKQNKQTKSSGVVSVRGDLDSARSTEVPLMSN